MTDTAVRDLLVKVLSWEDAHVGFDAVVTDIPEHMRGTQVSGLHSLWELVEHLRLTQHDILDFCRNKDYEEMEWPRDYWPTTPAPPSASAWDKSLGQFKRDRESFQQMTSDPNLDLTARIPHGNGQTYMRELVLAADHSAYHIGQLVLVRQLLGIWKH
ncbi:MAG TPA: DinB family protein [Gemmatimonadaceae bacterium]|nr:DinB family protein [Gemmatimonadaceae bacterium]